MTTEEIAKRLVTYCLRADWTGAYDELYADNARSIEPYASAEFQKEIIGLEAMRAKSKKLKRSSKRSMAWRYPSSWLPAIVLPLP